MNKNQEILCNIFIQARTFDPEHVGSDYCTIRLCQNRDGGQYKFTKQIYNKYLFLYTVFFISPWWVRALKLKAPQKMNRGWQGVFCKTPPSPTPAQFFLKLLSISICKIVHVRNTHIVFSCGLHFSSEFMYNISAFGIYHHLN